MRKSPKKGFRGFNGIRTRSLFGLFRNCLNYDSLRWSHTHFTSDYPENHPSGIKTGVNKKVIGKFKDEVAGKQITHFVGLRPKLYTFKVEEKGETRKAKGVKKNVIKKSLSFEDYKKCLFTEEEVMKEMNIIGSQNHEIFSMSVNKVALSANDDKRLICENKIDTLALR